MKMRHEIRVCEQSTDGTVIECICGTTVKRERFEDAVDAFTEHETHALGVSFHPAIVVEPPRWSYYP